MLWAIKTKPKGIFLFAILLICGSLYKLFGFLDYDYYVFMFQELPVGKIRDRYMMSISYRILGLLTAFGLMSHKAWARRLFMLLCSVTLITIYWKHPYSVFQNIAIYFEQQKGINTFPPGTLIDKFAYPLYPENITGYKLVYPLHPIVFMLFHCLIDLIFCGWALFYFSKPKIKSIFNK